MSKDVVLCEDCENEEGSRSSTEGAGKLIPTGAIWVVLCFLLGGAWVFADELAGPLVINYTSGTYQYHLAVQGDCAWIGTEGGLVLTKGDTGQRLKFTPADWRGAPGAGSVVIDASGSIWACPSDSYGWPLPVRWPRMGMEGPTPRGGYVRGPRRDSARQ